MVLNKKIIMVSGSLITTSSIGVGIYIGVKKSRDNTVPNIQEDDKKPALTSSEFNISEGSWIYNGIENSSLASAKINAKKMLTLKITEIIKKTENIKWLKQNKFRIKAVGTADNQVYTKEHIKFRDEVVAAPARAVEGKNYSDNWSGVLRPLLMQWFDAIINSTANLDDFFENIVKTDWSYILNGKKGSMKNAKKTLIKYYNQKSKVFGLIPLISQMKKEIETTKFDGDLFNFWKELVFKSAASKKVYWDWWGIGKRASKLFFKIDEGDYNIEWKFYMNKLRDYVNNEVFKGKNYVAAKGLGDDKKYSSDSIKKREYLTRIDRNKVIAPDSAVLGKNYKAVMNTLEDATKKVDISKIISPLKIIFNKNNEGYEILLKGIRGYNFSDLPLTIKKKVNKTDQWKTPLPPEMIYT